MNEHFKSSKGILFLIQSRQTETLKALQDVRGGCYWVLLATQLEECKLCGH